MYNAIWKKIKELAPDFQKNLHFIMSDYEAAAISSMNENFPQSKIHGCWFHFNQVYFILIFLIINKLCCNCNALCIDKTDF